LLYLKLIQISAVVLSYKGGDRLIPTLESCKLQTYPNKDLVIADDASPDDGYSVSIIEKWLEENRHHFTNVCFIKNRQNQGIVKNLRNAALEAKGDIIFPLGQGDTCYGPDTFQLIAKEIQKQRKKCLEDPYLWLTYYKTFIVEPKLQIVDHIVTSYCPASAPYQFNLIRDNPEKALQILLYDNFIGGASFIYLKRYFTPENFPLPDNIRDIEDYPSLLFMLIENNKIGFVNFYSRYYEYGVGITFQNSEESSKRMAETHKAISIWLNNLANKDKRLYQYLNKKTIESHDPRMHFSTSTYIRFYKRFILPIKKILLTKASGKPFCVDWLWQLRRN